MHQDRVRIVCVCSSTGRLRLCRAPTPQHSRHGKLIQSRGYSCKALLGGQIFRGRIFGGWVKGAKFAPIRYLGQAVVVMQEEMEGEGKVEETVCPQCVEIWKRADFLKDLDRVSWSEEAESFPGVPDYRYVRLQSLQVYHHLHPNC